MTSGSSGPKLLKPRARCSSLRRCSKLAWQGEEVMFNLGVSDSGAAKVRSNSKAFSSAALAMLCRSSWRRRPVSLRYAATLRSQNGASACPRASALRWAAMAATCASGPKSRALPRSSLQVLPIGCSTMFDASKSTTCRLAAPRS